MKKVMKNFILYKKRVYKGLLYVVSTFGILLFFAITFRSLNIDEEGDWFRLLEKIADFIVISVLASCLFSMLQYLEIFKTLVGDVIFSDELLKNMKNIESIWFKVSRFYFNYKFPQICDELLPSVKKMCFPDEDIKWNYYGDYNIVYKINYKKGRNGFVENKMNVDFYIETYDEELFDFPLYYYLNYREEDKEEVSIDLVKLFVNDEEFTIDKSKKKITAKDGIYSFEYTIPLKGCKRYAFRMEFIKILNFNYDNYLAFNAKWLIKNMTVKIFHPSDMDVIYVRRGTEKNFRKSLNEAEYKEYKYDGLILKQQGCFFVFNKKQKNKNGKNGKK